MKTVVSLVALGLLVLGCGSDDHADRDQPVASADASEAGTDAVVVDPAGPVASYSAWLDALAAHDAQAACTQHDPELTIALRREAILLDRAELGDPCTGFVAILWEEPTRELRPRAVEATQVTDEDAVLAVDFPGVDQTVVMSQRNGSWLVVSSSPRDERAPGPERWLGAWCDLDLGMDRAAVISLMGEPSGEYTVSDGGEPQLYWTQRQYDFRAYLDVDGRVLDLVGDYDALSASDRSLLACPELR